MTRGTQCIVITRPWNPDEVADALPRGGVFSFRLFAKLRGLERPAMLMGWTASKMGASVFHGLHLAELLQRDNVESVTVEWSS